MSRSEIEARGKAMAEFCRRVRERGGVAVTEETEDLIALRAEWIVVVATTRGRSA
jgi:hypothetical protein